MRDSVHRWPSMLLVGAIAALAVHAMDDAIAQPEPGTDLAGHALEVVAVLAVLGLAVLGVRRWRAGAVGAIALALVPPAAAGFALAVADAQHRGATGDDWTGFLLLPAALALLAGGVYLLWSSRRRDGRVLLRRVLIAVVSIVFLYEVEAGVVMAIVATHRPHDAVARIDLGAPASTVSLRTADGVKLAAYYVPSRNGAAVILFPRAAGAQAHARMLVRNGFGVLAVDARGYGSSQGDPNAFGWGTTRDIDAAVAYLRHRPDVLSGGIGGLGLSVGGEQMLEAASENTDLAAVVSDGAGERSVKETVTRGWKAALAIPEAFVQSTAVGVFSGQAPPASLNSLVGRIAPRATFFIHSERGGGAEDLTPAYYARAGQPKAYWRVPGAAHIGGITSAPGEYQQRVVGFLLAHLHHRTGG